MGKRVTLGRYTSTAATSTPKEMRIHNHAKHVLLILHFQRWSVLLLLAFLSRYPMPSMATGYLCRLPLRATSFLICLITSWV